jgi:hypothetical protein
MTEPAIPDELVRLFQEAARAESYRRHNGMIWSDAALRAGLAAVLAVAGHNDNQREQIRNEARNELIPKSEEDFWRLFRNDPVFHAIAHMGVQVENSNPVRAARDGVPAAQPASRVNFGVPRVGAPATDAFCAVDDCPSGICGGPHRKVETSLGVELLRFDQEPIGTPVVGSAQDTPKDQR